MGITHVIRGEDLLSSTPRQVLVYQGARRAGAVVRAPAAALRARPQAALQAPRRDERRGAARGRLPGRGGRQLPRPARLALRLRARAVHARGADRPLLAGARQLGAGRLRRQEARVDERRLPARAADVRPRRAADRLPRGARLAARRAAASGSSRSRRWRRRRSRRSPSSSRSARSSSGRSRSTQEAWDKVAGHERAAEIMAAVQTALADCDWTADAVEATLRGVCEQLELKPRVVFGLVRVAITGTSISPGLFESVHLLGRDEALARLARGRRAPRLAPGATRWATTAASAWAPAENARPSRAASAPRAAPAASARSGDVARAPGQRGERPEHELRGAAGVRAAPARACCATFEVGEAVAPPGGVGQRRWRRRPRARPSSSAGSRPDPRTWRSLAGHALPWGMRYLLSRPTLNDMATHSHSSPRSRCRSASAPSSRSRSTSASRCPALVAGGDERSLVLQTASRLRLQGRRPRRRRLEHRRRAVRAAHAGRARLRHRVGAHGRRVRGSSPAPATAAASCASCSWPAAACCSRIARCSASRTTSRSTASACCSRARRRALGTHGGLEVQRRPRRAAAAGQRARDAHERDDAAEGVARVGLAFDDPDRVAGATGRLLSLLSLSCRHARRSPSARTLARSSSGARIVKPQLEAGEHAGHPVERADAHAQERAIAGRRELGERGRAGARAASLEREVEQHLDLPRPRHAGERAG